MNSYSSQGAPTDRSTLDYFMQLSYFSISIIFFTLLLTTSCIWHYFCIKYYKHFLLYERH